MRNEKFIAITLVAFFIISFLLGCIRQNLHSGEDKKVEETGVTTNGTVESVEPTEPAESEDYQEIETDESDFPEIYIPEIDESEGDFPLPV
mgnify:CR=1 FL=1